MHRTSQDRGLLDLGDFSRGIPPLQGLQPGVRGAALDGDEEAVDDPPEIGIGAALVEAADGHAESVTAPDGAGKARDLPALLPNGLDGFRIDGGFSHAYRVRFSGASDKLRVS